ncbi:MAG: hypothetical protein JJD98_12565 [Polaromonas sp.]|nr:hypothetical protein [Polaromonas sp.]
MEYQYAKKARQKTQKGKANSAELVILQDQAIAVAGFLKISRWFSVVLNP